MNGTEAIRTMLDTSRDWLMSLSADVKDGPLTFPTSKGGNHPVWAIGHIVHSEASLVSEFILGEPNPLSKWDTLFGMGSEPVADADKYPPLDELMSEFEKVRGRTLELLGSYKDEDLSRPSKAPAELKETFGTIGRCLGCAALHTTFHAGQIADARRAMGKKPVFG